MCLSCSKSPRQLPLALIPAVPTAESREPLGTGAGALHRSLRTAAPVTAGTRPGPRAPAAPRCRFPTQARGQTLQPRGGTSSSWTLTGGAPRGTSVRLGGAPCGKQTPLHGRSVRSARSSTEAARRRSAVAGLPALGGQARRGHRGGVAGAARGHRTATPSIPASLALPDHRRPLLSTSRGTPRAPTAPTG